MEAPADRAVKLQTPVRIDGTILSELILSVTREGVSERLRSLRLIPGQEMNTGDWLTVLAELTGLPRSALQKLHRRDIMAAAQVAVQMLPAALEQKGALQ